MAEIGLFRIVPGDTRKECYDRVYPMKALKRYGLARAAVDYLEPGAQNRRVMFWPANCPYPVNRLATKLLRASTTRVIRWGNAVERKRVVRGDAWVRTERAYCFKMRRGLTVKQLLDRHRTQAV
jgi:hypothetical protein